LNVWEIIPASCLANPCQSIITEPVTTTHRLVFLACLGALFALVQGLVIGPVDLDAPDPWGIGWQELENPAAVLWVDARAQSAYEGSHFPGAKFLSLDDWDAGLSTLLIDWDPGVPIVVYCDGNGCDSSRTVAERLRQELESEEVYWLVGGWEKLSLEGPQ
jgi:rhodanese-related sulfurtransferase